MEETPDLLALGPEAALYAILDAVVDGYAPVVTGVQNDIDEIETEVFSGDPAVSRRIYELSREMVEFQRATRPLVGMLHALMAGFAIRHTRGTAALPARRGRPCDAHERARGRIPPSAVSYRARPGDDEHAAACG